MVRGSTRFAILLWKISQVGLSFLFYDRLPRHFNKQRAKWTLRTGAWWEEMHHTRHTMKWSPLPCSELLQRLRQERAMMYLQAVSS